MNGSTGTILDPLPANMLAALREFAGDTVDAAIVLGSGLGNFAESLDVARRIPTSSIPGYPASTVTGHAGELLHGAANGRSVLAFLGRIHSYEGYAAEDTALPARIASALGAGAFIVTNAAGGLHPGFETGDLMLITDFLVLPQAVRMGLPLHGRGTPSIPLPRPLFSETMLDLARESFREAGVAMREGTYGYCSGPTYETRSEIAMFRMMGADAAGMSTAPELIAGARLGLPTIGLSCITNKAVTVARPVTHEDVTSAAQEAAERFSAVLFALLARL